MNDELIAILDRITKKEQTDADMKILRDWLGSGKKLVSQSGKYAINLERGQNIYIGDRIYLEPDAEAIREIVRSLLDELSRKKMPNYNSLKILFVVLLLGLSGTAIYKFVISYPPRITESISANSTFTDFCKNRQSNPEQKPIIEILLRNAGSKNCELADKKLATIKQLNLSDLHDEKNLIVGEILVEYKLDKGLPNNIQVLSSLTQLEELDLSGHPQVTDISALRSLKHLQKLDLEVAQLTNNLSDLRYLPELKILNLAKNGITDITALASLQNLTDLNLSSNNIEDVSSLSSLKNLTKLDLRGTKVTPKICPVPETPNKSVCKF
jgi:Leucine-rich repeat (LRR) protein